MNNTTNGFKTNLTGFIIQNRKTVKRRLRFLAGYVAAMFGIYLEVYAIADHDLKSRLAGYVFILLIAPILLMPRDGGE